MEVNIDPVDPDLVSGKWSDLRWDTVAQSDAPFVQDEGVFQHMSGEGSGYLEYAFDCAGEAAKLTVEAKLSSEYNYLKQEQGPTPSEVVVSVNGTEIGREMVMADNARGVLYRWVVEDAGKLDLARTGNRLRFEVPPSADLANGLCVYSGRAAVEEYATVPIEDRECVGITIRGYGEGEEIGSFQAPVIQEPFNPRDVTTYLTVTNPRDGGTDEYCTHVPKSYAAGEPHGLIIYLHSMGGRCDSVAGSLLIPLAGRRKLMVMGVSRRVLEVREEGKLPYVDLEIYHAAVEAAVEEVRSAYEIDPERIYTLGSSMGGGPSLHFAADHEYVSAAATVHGVKMDESRRKALSRIPVYLMHGDADRAVPVDVSLDLAKALRELGGEAELVIGEGVRHEWVGIYDPAKVLDFYERGSRQS